MMLIIFGVGYLSYSVSQVYNGDINANNNFYILGCYTIVEMVLLLSTFPMVM